MQPWYPGAVKKPLGKQTESPVTPRVLIFHTMSGYLAGTDSMFRQGGYSGTESHFGVGGSWDKGDLDGVVWQWQSIDRQADAQFAGNAYATSIETSDGARDGIPWSPKQLTSLIDLATWWCQQTGVPARLVTSPSDSGFGFHSQFASWNRNGHDCPGDARVHQLRHVIIPEVAHRLGTKPTPRLLRLADPMIHGEDVAMLQRTLNLVQARPKIAVDSVFGAATKKAVQRFQSTHNLDADGIVGPLTWAALTRASAKT